MVVSADSTFLLPSLVNGGPLRDAIVVTLPHNVGVWGEREDALDCLTASTLALRRTIGSENQPNLDVSPPINPRPDAHDILAAPDAENSTADFLASLGELVPHDCKEHIFPVPVGDALFESDDPFATSFVLLVLPDRPYAFLKQMIVGDRRKGGRTFEMGIDGPK